MIVDSAASDIVLTSLFTGVHGSYLRGSISNAGLDADNLPAAGKDSMNFGSGSPSEAKAWRDIWGAGQGVGSIDDIPAVGDLVERMAQEYQAARKRLCIP